MCGPCSSKPTTKSFEKSVSTNSGYLILRNYFSHVKMVPWPYFLKIFNPLKTQSIHTNLPSVSKQSGGEVSYRRIDKTKCPLC